MDLFSFDDFSNCCSLYARIIKFYVMNSILTAHFSFWYLLILDLLFLSSGYHYGVEIQFSSFAERYGGKFYVSLNNQYGDDSNTLVLPVDGKWENGWESLVCSIIS